jgi:hypothetical protein
MHDRHGMWRKLKICRIEHRLTRMLSGGLETWLAMVYEP